MHDFIAIGDTVIDAFIKLKDAHVHANLDHESQEICLPFATKIPYESVEEVVAVGNSANAAVAAARLGLNSALVTNLGADDNGKKCLERLSEETVDAQYIRVHEGKHTNYHYVLWYGPDRTILVKHEEYEYKLPDVGEPKWLYLSSLADHTESYHQEIAEYVKAHPNINLAFQPGTFQINLGKEVLKDIYARSKIFFCNVEEAQKILGLENAEVKDLMQKMRELGPEIVVITDGPKGAYAYDGENMWFQTPYPDPNIAYDRTGAGDAFASTTVSALALGLDLPHALQWGAVNSLSVVQHVGAQQGLLTRTTLEEWLHKATPEFQTQKMA